MIRKYNDPTKRALSSGNQLYNKMTSRKNNDIIAVYIVSMNSKQVFIFPLDRWCLRNFGFHLHFPKRHSSLFWNIVIILLASQEVNIVQCTLLGVVSAQSLALSQTKTAKPFHISHGLRFQKSIVTSVRGNVLFVNVFYCTEFTLALFHFQMLFYSQLFLLSHTQQTSSETSLSKSMVHLLLAVINNRRQIVRYHKGGCLILRSYSESSKLIRRSEVIQKSPNRIRRDFSTCDVSSTVLGEFWIVTPTRYGIGLNKPL